MMVANLESKSVQRGSLCTTIVTSILLMIAILMLPAAAIAGGGWNFDPSCSEETVTEVEEPEKPNVFLMLDQSGSMGNLTDPYGNTLWSVAESAIDDAVASLQEELRFGLGFFPAPITECSWLSANCGDVACEYYACPISGCESGYTTTCRITSGPDSGDEFGCSLIDPDPVCEFRDGADEIVVSQDDAHGVISDELDDSYPSGGTPTWDAVQTIADSQSMNESGRVTGGVVVTDGQPCCHDSAREDTIDAICDARDNGYTNYAVGLGGATDQDFNNKMAAAMGTGCCGEDCDPDEGVGQDPCEQTVDNQECKGAYHADDQAGFENALLNIADEISCTFEVDISNYGSGNVPDDPSALKVEWLQYGTVETIPHRSESGEGWYFPSGDNREQISMTSEYCDDIRGGDGVDEVTTRLACDCQTPAGEPCDISDPEFGECPVGETSCDRGFDVCEPLSLDMCPVDCPGMDSVIGEPCHIDNDGDITESGPPTSPNDWTTETNRCKVGEVHCSGDGTELICEEVYSPMPELCDGLDNSCDGSINNINQSWSDWYAGEGQFEGGGAQDDPDLQPIGDTEEAAACWERDECLCDSFGNAEHVGQGQTVAEEFDAYMSAWDDYPEGCYCQVNMDR